MGLQSNGQGFPPLQYGSKVQPKHTDARGSAFPLCNKPVLSVHLRLDAEEQALLEEGGGSFPAEGEAAEHGFAHYWNTVACLVGPARPSELAGGLVSLMWALYEFGPPARRMGIRPLGLTRAECIVCWLLACHLEAISTEMVSSTCCALGVARGQPSTAQSREPGAFRFLSDFQFKTQ